MSEAAADRIRVAVVDDHEMFRAGVIATLRDSFDIVGQAADVPGSVAMIAQTKPQVVLLDVHVPGGEGGRCRDPYQVTRLLPRYCVPGLVGFGRTAGCGFGDSRRCPRVCDQDDYWR